MGTHLPRRSRQNRYQALLELGTFLRVVFLLILPGWGLRHGHVPGKACWRPAYFLFFPALIVPARCSGQTVAPIAAAIALVIVVMTLLRVAARACFRSDD